MENNNLPHGQIELTVSDVEKNKPSGKKNKKILILIICITVVLLGVAVGIFMFRDSIFSSQKNQADYTNMNQENTSNVVQADAPFVPVPGFEHDWDQDGLLDTEEAKLGTSDRQYDTDGDSITDKEEVERFGTDPNKIDTDGDGFSDFAEIVQGYNPKGDGKL